MRAFAFIVALFALPAAAQTTPSAEEMTTAAANLGALWRPLPDPISGDLNAAFTAACEGALEELEQLANALPSGEISPEAVRGLRSTRGLVLVPGADPGQIFIFPNPSQRTIAGGLGAFALADPAQGRIDLTDAAGTVIEVQLGQSSGTAILRMLVAGQRPQAFVGCAPTG